MPTRDSDQPVTYYVDEAGDGVLFGRKGRVIIEETKARRYFMLGMIRCGNDRDATRKGRTASSGQFGKKFLWSTMSMIPTENNTAHSTPANQHHPTCIK